MNRTKVIVAMAMVLAGGTAWAAPGGNDMRGAGMKGAMDQGMPGNVDDMSMPMMRENMKDMRNHMQQMSETGDMESRMEQMQTHMKKMQRHMEMMQHMMEKMHGDHDNGDMMEKRQGGRK